MPQTEMIDSTLQEPRQCDWWLYNGVTGWSEMDALLYILL